MKIQTIINFSHDQSMLVLLNVLSIFKFILITPKHFFQYKNRNVVYVVKKETVQEGFSNTKKRRRTTIISHSNSNE